MRHCVFTTLALILTILLSNGCGGGISGTGIKQFEGTVTTAQGRTLANVIVTVTETGDNATTNETGSFSILATLGEGEANLQVTSNTVDDTIPIEGLPKKDALISIAIEIDEVENTVETKSLEIEKQSPNSNSSESSNVSSNQNINVADDTPTGSNASNAQTFVSGKLVTPDGTPLSGIVITIAETGDTVVTDGDGNFSFPDTLDVASPSLTLLVEGGNFSTHVFLDATNTENTVIDINLEVDNISGSVTPTSVDVSAVDTPDDNTTSTTPNPTQDAPDSNTPTETTSDAITGQVISPTGEPLGQVIVIIEETGEGVLTDENGNFVFPPGSASGEVTLNFITTGSSSSVELDNTGSSNGANIEIELDTTSGDISATTTETQPHGEDNSENIGENSDNDTGEEVDENEQTDNSNETTGTDEELDAGNTDDDDIDNDNDNDQTDSDEIVDEADDTTNQDNDLGNDTNNDNNTNPNE